MELKGNFQEILINKWNKWIKSYLQELITTDYRRFYLYSNNRIVTVLCP